MAKHVFFYFYLLMVFYVSQGREAKNGVLDLSKCDLEEEIITLDGEWEIYWNQLLSRKDLNQYQGKVDYFDFPELWNNHKTKNGQALSPFGYATYHLKVLLPEERPLLSFYIKHFYSSYLLMVDDQVILSSGKVGSSDETSSPNWIPQAVMFSGTGDTLDIILQISNFRHSKGGARESILLSSKENIESQFIEVLGYDLLLCGGLIMTGLFFLGLYYFGQREKSAIYFSIFCLTFAYRVIAADDYSLLVLNPNYNWTIFLKLEYLSLFVPPLFFALYTHSLYPMDSKHFILKGFAIISGLLSLATIILPSTIFTHFVDSYLFLMLLAIIYCGSVYFTAVRNKRDGAKYAMLGTIPVLVIFIYKILIYVGSLQEIEFISFIGFVAFFFFQSLVLFFLFTKSLKNAKEEAERAVMAKSEFLSMMSHEIRTPMNAVVGLTNYLIEDNPKEDQVDSLKTLKFSAENLLVIINDILDFSKIEAGKVEFEEQPSDIHEILSNIKKTFAPIAKQKNLEFILKIDKQVPDHIICDTTRTSQIFSNLIGNAIKFTKKGRVTLGAELVETRKEEVSILFYIEDTGIGIPPERQPEVFKSFTQANTSINRQFGGTGLGLTITKRLLELQGSELKLESEENVGTKFYFTQTFRISQAPEKSRAQKTTSEGLLNANILLVEDNEVNRLVATKFLNKWGLTVTHAANGKEAVDIFKEEKFDLILMDLQMPIMDGYEAVRILRENGSRIPIIALTASALLNEQKKIYSAGMDDYVTKPFNPEELYAKIQGYTSL